MAAETDSVSVSVVMATWNGSRHLEDQLASLASQSRLPDELIVSDDNSDDETLQMLQKFRPTGMVVKILANDSRLGYAANFARALRDCTGDIALFCDQDDVWEPTKVECFVAALTSPGCTGAICDATIVDECLRPLGVTLWQRLRFTPRRRRWLTRDPFPALLTVNPGYGLAVGVTKQVVASMQPVPELLGHDTWALLVAAMLGSIAVIDAPLVCYRQHAGQVEPFHQARRGRSGLLADTRAGLVTHTRLDVMSERLPGIVASSELPRFESVVVGRREHLTRRAMLSPRRARRIGPILRELARGGYSRSGSGWRGALRDLAMSAAPQPGNDDLADAAAPGQG